MAPSRGSAGALGAAAALVVLFCVFDSQLFVAEQQRSASLHRRVFVDEVAHALTGLVAWELRRTLQQRMGAPVLGPVRSLQLIALLCSVVLDIDHFAAAGSLSLSDATHLRARPLLHCLPVALLAASPLLLCSRLAFEVAAQSVLIHHLRDATRRGLTLLPAALSGGATTPPLPGALYLAALLAVPAAFAATAAAARAKATGRGGAPRCRRGGGALRPLSLSVVLLCCLLPAGALRPPARPPARGCGGALRRSCLPPGAQYDGLQLRSGELLFLELSFSGTMGTARLARKAAKALRSAGAFASGEAADGAAQDGIAGEDLEAVKLRPLPRDVVEEMRGWSRGECAEALNGVAATLYLALGDGAAAAELLARLPAAGAAEGAPLATARVLHSVESGEVSAAMRILDERGAADFPADVLIKVLVAAAHLSEAGAAEAVAALRARLGDALSMSAEVCQALMSTAVAAGDASAAEALLMDAIRGLGSASAAEIERELLASLGGAFARELYTLRGLSARRPAPLSAPAIERLSAAAARAAFASGGAARGFALCRRAAASLPDERGPRAALSAAAVEGAGPAYAKCLAEGQDGAAVLRNATRSFEALAELDDPLLRPGALAAFQETAAAAALAPGGAAAGAAEAMALLPWCGAAPIFEDLVLLSRGGARTASGAAAVLYACGRVDASAAVVLMGGAFKSWHGFASPFAAAERRGAGAEAMCVDLHGMPSDAALLAVVFALAHLRGRRFGAFPGAPGGLAFSPAGQRQVEAALGEELAPPRKGRRRPKARGKAKARPAPAEAHAGLRIVTGRGMNSELALGPLVRRRVLRLLGALGVAFDDGGAGSGVIAVDAAAAAAADADPGDVEATLALLREAKHGSAEGGAVRVGPAGG